MTADDLPQKLNRLRLRCEEQDRVLAELRARVETLEQIITELRRLRGNAVGVAGGQPRPNERGRI